MHDQLIHCLAPVAFSKETLLEQRWLLGGTVRVASSLWHSVLQMEADKQLLFMERGFPFITTVLSNLF